ncbi:hypothetical protein GX51_04995 [Blastomyces parvus]|uniref:Uncharacterized protein n=1 Tax=Blastomyces parvus TaxID=2060905 RepID=A0A2B7WYQ9_9EURO|nr:hypothetical protein GX51_04995 [Blastomyces parvus]
MLWYLPRKYRPPILFKILIGIELPITIAVLALFGIASPDLYRTKLWKDGAQNGFNSGPEDKVYAFANYRPYTTPKPWSQFLTNFNLVISVLSMFVMLVKTPMFILNVFYPPFSVIVHTALTALYAVSIAYQASPDMADPALFLVHIVFAAYSCLPTEEVREKQRQRLERRKELEDLKSLKSPVYPMHAPMTPGGTAFPPMTPRTQAFNRLGGTTDLPLRNHFLPPDTPNGVHAKNFSMPSPPHSPTPPQMSGSTPNGTPPPNRSGSAEGQSQPTVYFPPPPKKASK